MIDIKDVSLNDASLVGVETEGGNMTWIVEGGWINDKFACFKIHFHNVMSITCDGEAISKITQEGEDGDVLGFHVFNDKVKCVVEWWQYPPSHLKPKSYDFEFSGLQVDLVSWMNEE